MKQLRITKAKPNPAGKDWFPFDIPAEQLAAEWVDFENTGDERYNLVNIELYHKTNGGEWKKVESFRGILPIGEVVRVHSGGGPETILRPEDKNGAEHHLFTGKGYVWNNDIGDEPRLWNSYSKVWVDKTFYDAYPPEGAILLRVGNKLIP